MDRLDGFQHSFLDLQKEPMIVSSFQMKGDIVSCFEMLTSMKNE